MKQIYHIKFIILSFLIFSLIPVLAHAQEDKTWVGGDGAWDDADNWSPAGLPVNGDSAFIPDSVTVLYENFPATISSTVLQNIEVNGDLNLNVTWEYTHLKSRYLTVGVESTDTGNISMTDNLDPEWHDQYNPIYELLPQVRLDVLNEAVIGKAGYGSFYQNGGETYLSSSVLGYDATGMGAYILDSGILKGSQSGTMKIGNSGEGYFEQNGGENRQDNLIIGAEADGSGAYILNNGNLKKVSYGYIANTIIGDKGSGLFEHNGGNVELYWIKIGNQEGGSGSYNLSTEALTRDHELNTNANVTASGLMIGNAGEGGFTQSGGLITTSEFSIGREATGSGNYEITGGELQVLSNVYVGYNGNGTMSQLYDEILPENGFSEVYVGNPGDWWSNSDLFVGGVSDAEYEYAEATGTGEYNLEHGNLSVTGSEYIGMGGTGVFNQGSLEPGRESYNDIDGDLYIGGGESGNGTYNMYSGELHVDYGHIRNDGVFNLYGGEVYVNDDFINNGILSGDTGEMHSDTVINSGVSNPGFSIGLLEVDDFINTSTGILNIDIGSLGHDIFWTQTAFLEGGILNVSLLDGFIPEYGAYFDVLNSTDIYGEFEKIIFPQFELGYFDYTYNLFEGEMQRDFLRLTYNEKQLPSNTLPEPATISLFAIGLLGMGRFLRKR